ncbi:hypothetical protein B0E33_10860 [Roseibium algicola]|uniref:Transposase n=1 Tax=Roseibium algicola TaxID=2857014 RepID=A0ABM6I109_9HYPH|nr:hypothetical protein ACP90_26795 [Labrenzia sp. CP4]AQQ04025.1 hypothetical protein B0E33_10860 [Roseibium aggregatum]
MGRLYRTMPPILRDSAARFLRMRTVLLKGLVKMLLSKHRQAFEPVWKAVDRAQNSDTFQDASHRSHRAPAR